MANEAPTAVLTTTPMRSATTNTVPRFALPAGSCDTHFHVFEPGYPHVTNPLYTFPDGTVEQYLRLVEFLGFERMVLVQPTYYGTDNSLTVDTLRRLGPRCRAVVRVEDGVTSGELDRLHEAGARAIRLDLFARADWPVVDLVSYIRAVSELARPRGWHLQFYSPGWVIRDLVPFLATFEDPFVIDHMGYMLASDGLTGDDFERLLAVLAQGSCWIKLSGPYRLAKDKPMSTVEQTGRALVATRPDRLLWGSDWPHLPNGQRDTGQVLNLLSDWAPDAQDRRKILVDGPTQLFYTD